MTAPDLAAAATVTDLASQVVDAATRRLAAAGSIDDHQVLAYEVAHAAGGWLRQGPNAERVAGEIATAARAA